MSSETPDHPETTTPESKDEAKKPRRSSPRRSRSKKAASAAQSQDTSAAVTTEAPDATPSQSAPPTSSDEPPAGEPAKGRARRSKKAPRPRQPEEVAAAPTPGEAIAPPVATAPDSPAPTPAPEAQPAAEPVKGRSRNRNKKSPRQRGGQEEETPAAVEAVVVADTPPAPSLPEEAKGDTATTGEPPARKRSRRKRKRGGSKNKAAAQQPSPPPTEVEEEGEEAEVAAEAPTDDDGKPRSIKLLINAEEPEECRVALLENGKLESFHVETIAREQHRGNIYKGRIVSIETNLQAAFVDIGTGKNGFLPFNEIHPEYYNREVPPDSHWKNFKIKEVLREGQEVLVEVVKDVTGNKGASLTTYISLPGRYVVLMPGSDSHGISKKIDKEEERQKLRDMLAACNIPEGVGYIIRTASDGITKTALTNDVRYQIKLWAEIKAKGQSEPAPALLYKEQSIIDRFLRDHFSSDIEEILVDSQEAYEQVNDFLNLLPAAQRKKTSARLHKGPRPLLNSYNIEEQIEQIFKPTVKLPSGGSIVINPTEALVAIDVNSGSTGRDKNFDETIFLANMEAAEELARQLRLRDLGGLIVVDFIDMRPMSHIKEVEKKVKASMKRDKAKVDFSRISKFGLMEISRQRMGAPIQTGSYQTCEYCQGHGMVRSVETQALAFLRQIQTGVTRKHVATVHCLLPMEVGQYLLNKKRADLAEMERDHRVSIVIETAPTLKPAEAKIEFIKER